MELKKYKHEAPYSYTLGMAPTLELIQYKPDAVDKIYVHPEYTPRDEIYNIFRFLYKGIIINHNKNRASLH